MNFCVNDSQSISLLLELDLLTHVKRLCWERLPKYLLSNIVWKVILIKKTIIFVYKLLKYRSQTLNQRIFTDFLWFFLGTRWFDFLEIEI